MDVAIDVEGESLSSSSLVLSTASPFLHALLSSLNHCHGCSQRKTIFLPEEDKGTVRGLLDRLHAKYLKIPRLGQTDSEEEQINVRDLAKRLGFELEDLGYDIVEDGEKKENYKKISHQFVEEDEGTMDDHYEDDTESENHVIVNEDHEEIKNNERQPEVANSGKKFRQAEKCLELDFTLEVGQEAVACVDLEGVWSEGSKIFRHPDFQDPDIQLVKGEVGEGGDHMNVTFKNNGAKPVTIAGDRVVISVNEDPSTQDLFVTRAPELVGNKHPPKTLDHIISTNTIQTGLESNDSTEYRAKEKEGKLPSMTTPKRAKRKKKKNIKKKLKERPLMKRDTLALTESSDEYKLEATTCIVCKKVFTTKWSMQEHRESVHEGLKYSCSHCKHIASSKRNLRAHFGKKHPECLLPSQYSTIKESNNVCVDSKNLEKQPEPSESDEEIFEVEKILDKQTVNGKTVYYIKWKGYEPEEENTWEPTENLNCQDKIQEFEANYIMDDSKIGDETNQADYDNNLTSHTDDFKDDHDEPLKIINVCCKVEKGCEDDKENNTGLSIVNICSMNNIQIKEETGNQSSSKCPSESFIMNSSKDQFIIKAGGTYTHSNRQVRQKTDTALSEPNPAQTKPKQKPGRVKRFCGLCGGCRLMEDCGECVFCQDKPKFGGPNVKKQKCELRWCELHPRLTLHPRLNRGPVSLRKEAIKCGDCDEEYFTNSHLRNHMNIVHLKYDYNGTFYKVRAFVNGYPHLTMAKVDEDSDYEHLVSQEDLPTNTGEAEKNSTSVDVQSCTTVSLQTKSLKVEIEEDQILLLKAKLKRSLELQRKLPEVPLKRRCSTSLLQLPCMLCKENRNNKSDLYGHYSRLHFKDDLLLKVGADTRECTICKKVFTSQVNMVTHFGSVHNMLEEFLPKEYHIVLNSSPPKDNIAKEAFEIKDSIKEEVCDTNPIVKTPSKLHVNNQEETKPVTEANTGHVSKWKPFGQATPYKRKAPTRPVAKKEKTPFLEEVVMHVQKQISKAKTQQSSTKAKKQRQPSPNKWWKEVDLTSKSSFNKKILKTATNDKCLVSMVAHMAPLAPTAPCATSLAAHRAGEATQAQCYTCGEQFASVRRAIIHEVEVCQSLHRYPTSPPESPLSLSLLAYFQDWPSQLPDQGVPLQGV